MSDDFIPDSAPLRELFHQAAVAIDPGRPPVDMLRRRYVQRQRRTRAVLAGGALAVAVVAVPGLVGSLAGSQLGVTGPAASLTGAVGSQAAPAPARVTASVGGHSFVLPQGFRVTSGPTVTRLTPGPGNPLQEAGASDVLVGEEPSSGGRARQIVIAVYRGAVGTAMNGRTPADLFGATASRQVVVAGRSALVATVGEVSVGADGRAEFKLPLDRKAEIPSGVPCATQGTPVAMVCRLTPQQAEDLRLVVPRPGVDVELEVGRDEHLSVRSSGIGEAEVLEVVTRALAS